MEDNASILDFVLSGGLAGNLIMFVLFVASLITVYLLTERYIIIQNTRKQIRKFTEDVNSYIEDNNLAASKKLIYTDKSMAAFVLKKSLQVLKKDRYDINEANTVIDNIANNEVEKLEKGFTALASIAGGAPMLGFLGTVIGMVQAFYKMSSAGSNFDVTTLSQGIYTAMFTTVGGLLVGIIAYFAYNFLVSQVGKIAHELESVKIGFIELRN